MMQKKRSWNLFYLHHPLNESFRLIDRVARYRYARILRNNAPAEPIKPVPRSNSVLGSGTGLFDIVPAKSRPEGSPDPPAGPVPALSTVNVSVLSPATNAPPPGSPTLNTSRHVMPTPDSQCPSVPPSAG